MINKKIRFDISEEKALALYNECRKKRKYDRFYNLIENNNVKNIDKMCYIGKTLSKDGDRRIYYKGLNCLDIRYENLKNRGLYDFEIVRVFWSERDRCIYLIPRCSKVVEKFWVPRILEILENFVKGEVK